MSRRTLTSIVAAILLATTPATALADGAGDQQYQDPLTAPSTPKKTQKKATTAPAASTPAATTAPAAVTAPTSTSSSSGSTAATPAAPSSAQQLPRTGAPTGLIALGGAALIVSGAALRRRTATR